MTKLTFPTIAEQVVKEFESSTRTVSLATLARRRGAEVRKLWPGGTEYIFDDDTTIEVRGRGRTHKYEVFLP